MDSQRNDIKGTFKGDIKGALMALHNKSDLPTVLCFSVRIEQNADFNIFIFRNLYIAYGIVITK